MSASRRFNSKEFRTLIGCKNIRFASPEEVFKVTGCIPGAVPPFSTDFNENVPMYVDQSLEENESINFNCGLRTHSFSMLYKDYALY